MVKLCQKKKSSSSPINPRHFFQPLIPGFLSNFSIPKSFAKRLHVEEDGNDVTNDKIAILGDKGGRTWEIKVDFQLMKFKDGWEKFCKDHDLQIGDFLVFRHQGHFNFDVLIFDPTCCERKFPSYGTPPTKVPTSHRNNGPRRTNVFPEDGNRKGTLKKIADIYKACSEAKLATFKPKGHPYCRTTVKPYVFKWGAMPLPTKFSKENNLEHNCGELILIDQRGMSWQLLLREHTNGGVYIGRWRHFHKENGLSAGDTVVFELIITGNLPAIRFYKISEAD